MALASSHHLHNFERLGDGVWLYKPPLSSHDAPPLDLIVLCTWMGAALRHVSKYTSHYQHILPHTQILIIQSDLPDVFWRTDAFQESRMAPARQVVRAAAHARNPRLPSESRIFMHVFSNGGCQTACQLATQLRAESGPPVRLRALVLDSCPGRASFTAAISALSALLPKTGLRRLWGLFLTYLGLCMVWVLQSAFRRELMVDKVRRLLNSSAMFGPAVPRTYVFSKVDKMIDWRDVHAHASAARHKGYPTREELFDSSDHVAHAMLDKDRYWSIVQSTYEQRVT